VAAPFSEKAVVLGDFRATVASDYLGQGFLEALSKPSFLMESGTLLLGGRNRLAVVTLPGSSGRPVEAVLKQFGLRGIDRLKTLIFPSKALKAWRGAKALVEKGIPTPLPLACLERKKGGLTAEAYYLAEKISSVQEVRHFFRSLVGKDLDGLLRSLAVFLREVHRRGILHKDLSDGNILLGSESQGGPVFFLLDTNRVRIKKNIGPLGAAGNLVRLGVPRRAQPSFLAYYWLGRPVPRFFGLWYRLRKKWYTGAVGLKKALRLKKLVRRMGLQ